MNLFVARFLSIWTDWSEVNKISGIIWCRPVNSWDQFMTFGHSLREENYRRLFDCLSREKIGNLWSFNGFSCQFLEEVKFKLFIFIHSSKSNKNLHRKNTGIWKNWRRKNNQRKFKTDGRIQWKSLPCLRYKAIHINTVKQRRLKTTKKANSSWTLFTTEYLRSSEVSTSSVHTIFLMFRVDWILKRKKKKKTLIYLQIKQKSCNICCV